MEPPESESGPPPATRSSRILGLVAAVSFSIAMWVFIAVAVLGLILKMVGPRGAEEGLQAVGINLPQLFGYSSDVDPAGAFPANAGPITGLDGQAIEPLGGMPPEAAKPAAEPAKPAPEK